MAIPSEHANRRIYHFTHLDNLPSLLRHGLVANNHSKFPRRNHRSIAAQSIQDRRADMSVTCGPEGVVHDYVPLYFGSLSLMLLGVINRKNIDQPEILYFEFPISLINDEDVVFTDASANTGVPPSFYSDPADLTKLNWNEIDSLKWKSGSEVLRHQRMAEILVHSHLPLSHALNLIVWNESIKKHVTQIAEKAGASLPPIDFESPQRRHYFTDFIQGTGTKSLVTGPVGIRRSYCEACKQVRKIGRPKKAPYNTPRDLLKALRKDFGCIQHTSELVGLKSANGMHRLTVDKHTLEVVTKLKSLSEYEELPSDSIRRKVELAAYLHDIGKGPKSRWKKSGGLQQVDPDHPVRAMPMMVEILTEQVLSITQVNAELLLKLVCYHDLVGEVLGKGRDESQIVDVAADELELNLLFALGRADATALREEWWPETSVAELRTRCLAAIKARGPHE